MLSQRNESRQAAIAFMQQAIHSDDQHKMIISAEEIKNEDWPTIKITAVLHVLSVRNALC